MKFGVLCSLVVALALVQVTVAQQHNFVEGKKGPNDKLVQRTNHFGRSSGYGIPATERVYYSDYNHGPIITYISATDHYTDGSGGSARILYGGVGDREVMIQLTSSKYAAFNFTIEIYG